MNRRVVLALLVVSAAGAASAGQVSVSCEPAPGGVRSLVVEAEGAAVEATEAEGVVRIDVADPGAGLEDGPLRCEPARSVQVVTGRLLGGPSTRVLVTLGRQVPRIVRAPGRVRLLWLPAAAGGSDAGSGAGAAEPEPPRTAAAEPPPRVQPPPRPPARQEAPEPPPAAPRTAPPPERAPAPDPSPRVAGGGVPADFLPFERPVTMVASVATETRSGAGRRFTEIVRLEAGARVMVNGRAGDWLRTSENAWVFGPYFEAPGEALEGGAWMAVVQAITSPVHAGPGPHHEVVAEIYRGEKVVIDDVQQDWAHVRDGGWVRMSELSRSEQPR